MTIGRFQCGIAALIRSAVDGRYLLLQRADSKDYAAGVWECVTGRLEQGEGFEQALHREVAEEIGAPVRLHCVLGTTHFHRGSPDDPTNESVGVVYGCVLDNPDAVARSSEHKEHRWVTAPEALALLTADDPSTGWMRGIIARSEALWDYLPPPWAAFAERLGLETDA
ncbi:NUDIX domain-containing protein [Nitrococcus mobilis]|uniref:Probable mutator mutt protein (7,8-dihydro-8-oxoguanine-triphosphatase) n=1 Tax=Nitrococcus mobilis Nb-231 TaxID=314278 RepID=A4BPS6_9GAMM|nr:NUDIX domain-containing protein [Nitrococcus mobilis]EAR22081.1 probable mutator mutt protein (7,8-dihydro-8-oxoguanine-triphosphatase) [Nitrococcus mobilis Nb-231]